MPSSRMRESRVGIIKHGESEKRQHGWKLVAHHASPGTAVDANDAVEPTSTLH